MRIRIFGLYIALCCAFFSCAAWKRYEAGQLMRRCSLELGAVRFEKIDFDENALNKLRDTLPIQDMLKQMMIATLSGKPLAATLVLLIPQIYAYWPTEAIARVSFQAELLIQNPDPRDTLWIRDLQGVIRLHSVTLPYGRAETVPRAIAPGRTSHTIAIEVPLSKEILGLTPLDSAEISGDLQVSRTPRDTPIAFSFSKKQAIPDFAELNQSLTEGFLQSILDRSFR